jgi:hypothetical protein
MAPSGALPNHLPTGPFAGQHNPGTDARISEPVRWPCESSANFRTTSGVRVRFVGSAFLQSEKIVYDFVS